MQESCVTLSESLSELCSQATTHLITVYSSKEKKDIGRKTTVPEIMEITSRIITSIQPFKGQKMVKGIEESTRYIAGEIINSLR